MKKVIYASLFVSLLASCDKSENVGVPRDEASTELLATADNMSGDIMDMMESEGVNAMSTLFDYTFSSSEFGDIAFRKEEHKYRIIEFTRIFAQSPASRVSSDYSTGVYAWDVNEEDFVFVDESDDLILLFPTEGSETNNATFTLGDFEFDNNDLPTLISANITIDQVEVMRIELVASWSEDFLPVQATVDLYLNPFSLNLAFDDSADKQSSLTASLHNGETLLAAIDLSVTYPSAAKDFPSKVEGSVQYRTLKVAGLLNIEKAMQSNSGNPNEFVDMKVFVDDQKIGTIIFVIEEDDEYADYVPYIRYNDGSKESLEDLFEGIFDDFEDDLRTI